MGSSTPSLPPPAFNLQEITGWRELCFRQPSPDFESGEDFPLDVLNPTTLALINAASIVGLPCITDDNVGEWVYRITSLFDTGLTFLTTQTPEGDVPVPLTPMNIVVHIGLEVSIDTNLILGPLEFDQLIRRRRMGPIYAALHRVTQTEGYDDDEDNRS